jgi:glycosyltransferase involved in cell wall biosynthesis
MGAYKISVIIPVYNAQNYINRCIDSILNQTIEELEIIIVDDGSTDKTPEISNNYASNHSNIMVIHKTNEGQGIARNSGLAIAKGDYIAFVDADDYVEPHMYERMYREVIHAGADSCICGFKKVDEKKNVTEFPNPMGNQVFEGGAVHKDILLNIVGSMPSQRKDHILGLSVWKSLYSAKLIKENGIQFYSERVYYSEDTLFNIDYFIRAGKVVTIDEMFYYYEENVASFTKNYNEDMHLKNKRFYQLALQKLMTIFEYSQAKYRLQRLFLGFARSYLQRIVELYDRKTAINSIRNIVNDPEVGSIIQGYPYRNNPMKQRIIHHLIYKRKSALIWFVIYLNHFISNR